MKNKKMILGFVLLAMFSLLTTTNLFAQNWTRDTLKNNWGDITGYVYFQRATGVAHGSTDISVSIYFAYTTEDAQMRNVLIINSETIGDLIFHPAAGFFDEPVTVSLRSNGTTTTYKGSTVSSRGNYNNVYIYIIDSELINKLKSSGQWDILIEGKRWYIRSKIIGNLSSN